MLDGAMPVRWPSLIVSIALCLPLVAQAQTVAPVIRLQATSASVGAATNPRPNWCSYSKTGDPSCQQSATSVANELGLRMYANGGQGANTALTTPAINGGSSNGLAQTGSTLDSTSVLNGTNASKAMSTVLGASVARYLSAKLLDIVSIKDFGAIGDGVHDDTAAISSAIAYAKTTSYSGGRIFFPDGTYRITSTLKLVGSGFALVGQSVRGTTLLADFTNSNIIQIGDSNGNDDNERDGVYNLHITSKNKTTTGYAIWAEGVVNFIVDNVRLDGFLNGGIDIENPAGTTFGIYLSHLWIAGIQSQGLTIGGQSASQSTVVTDVFLTDSMILPGQSAADCGICLFGAGGFYASGVDITSQNDSHFNNAIKIAPLGTTDVNAVMLSRVLADSSNNENILFSGVGPIADVTITNGWANTSGTGSGIVFGNAQTDGVTIAATVVDSNAQNGIVINKGVNIGITGARILNNSMSQSGTFDGISVGAGVSGFSITDSQIGNGGWFNVSGHSDIHQRWAVNIDPNAGGGFVVANNRGFGNAQGFVNDQTTGANKSVTGNVNG